MPPKFLFFSRPLLDEHGAPGSGANPPATAAPAPPVISGGPGDPPKPAAAPAPAASAEPVYQGAGGTFKTPAELAAYTRSLEEKLVRAAMVPPVTQAATITPGAPPALERNELRDLSEEIFVNTEQGLEKLLSIAETRIEAKTAKADNRKKFWEGFYAENQDLRGVDFIVDLVEREHRSQLEPLSLSEAKKLIATKARERVHQVKKASGIVETEMPPGPATVVGSSGSGAPPKPGAAPQAISFADQVKQMQRRRRG